MSGAAVAADRRRNTKQQHNHTRVILRRPGAALIAVAAFFGYKKLQERNGGGLHINRLCSDVVHDCQRHRNRHRVRGTKEARINHDIHAQSMQLGMAYHPAVWICYPCSKCRKLRLCES